MKNIYNYQIGDKVVILSDKIKDSSQVYIGRNIKEFFKPGRIWVVIKVVGNGIYIAPETYGCDDWNYMAGINTPVEKNGNLLPLRIFEKIDQKDIEVVGNIISI